MDGTPIELESCTLDLEGLSADREGVRTPLTVHERDLLAALISRGGEPVDRQTLLSEVWQYAPSVVSRAVDVTVRRLRQKIELDPSNPRHLLTARGVGYRFVIGDVVHVSHPESSIDAPEGPLFGRESDKRAVMDWWATGGRARLLLGAPGAGTTTLAAWLAKSVDPLWWCDLEDKADRAAVLRTVAERVGVPVVRNPSDSALIERVGDAASGADRPLLVLDGLQAGIDLGEAVKVWLDSAAGLGILITAHHRPQKLDNVVLHPVEPIDGQAAEEMLDYHLGSNEAARDLAERADGLPGRLVELVGNVALLGPLPKELPLPSSRYQQAFEGAIERLSTESRELLSQLAVFPSDFDLASAMRVHPDPTLLDRVQELRETGVLAATEPGRFRILDLVRRSLEPARPETWGRFADQVLERASAASEASLHCLTPKRVGPERALAALVELARRGPIDSAALDALIEATGEPWCSHGRLLRATRATSLGAALVDLEQAHVAEARPLECRLLTNAGELKRALALPDVPPVDRARALRLAEQDESRADLAGIALGLRRAGDYPSEVYALTEAAWWALDLDATDEAERLALEALAASRLCADLDAGRAPQAVLAAVGLCIDGQLRRDLDLQDEDRAWLTGLAAWKSGDLEGALAAWDREWPAPLDHWTVELARAWVRALQGQTGEAMRAVRPTPPPVPYLQRIREGVRALAEDGQVPQFTRPWWTR